MAEARTRRLVWLIGSLGIVAVVLAAVALWRPWHVPTRRELPVVRVAYLPIYVDLPLFVAEKRGMFARHGVRVQLERFQTSPDMGAALVGRRVDAVASIATGSALAIQTRDPGKFRIFLVDAETPQNYLSSLLVASKSNITSVSELRGRTLGSFPGPTAQLWGPMALEKLGLPRGAYTVQELPIDSHLGALETGGVDAIITYEPTATQGVLRYNSRRLVPGLIESTVSNPWQAGIWIIGTDFTRENPDTGERFIRAIYEAVTYIREHPTEAKRALSQYTTIDPAIANETPNIPFTTAAEADLVALQRHANLLQAHGTLSARVDVATLMIPPLRPQDEE